MVLIPIRLDQGHRSHVHQRAATYGLAYWTCTNLECGATLDTLGLSPISQKFHVGGLQRVV